MSCTILKSPPIGGSDGFTLLEAIVALAILAISLTALFETYSTGLRSIQTSGNYSRAVVLAQSLMAETTASRRNLPASSRGISDGLTWRIFAKPAQGDLLRISSDTPWQLYRVSVTVSWQPRRRVQLTTLLLGARHE